MHCDERCRRLCHFFGASGAASWRSGRGLEIRGADGVGCIARPLGAPDGGYVIAIKSVEADGKLDASYANPNPLPFFAATAAEEGGKLKLFFELRAGGYNGSTYMLRYDAAGDQLKGTYYQAVARQTFEVVFVRK